MPREPDLALTSDPDPADVTAIHDLLSAFNAADHRHRRRPHVRDLAPRSVRRDRRRRCGWTWGGTCYVDTLFLPPALRRRGLGSRIVALVEATARARGCSQIVLHTHDFQAPAFYERLGFERIAATAEYPRGHAHLTMVKRLSGASAIMRARPAAASSPRNRARARPRSAGRRWHASG